jgi:hypothetical protein
VGVVGSNIGSQDTCGCGTRKETIGEHHFWTGITVGTAAVILALTYGGKPAKYTQQALMVGAAGFLVAVAVNVYRSRG